MTPLTRREFLKGAAAGTASLALADKFAFAEPIVSPKKKPNIIFIHTDQQHFEALSGLGNKYVRTPNMDRLLQSGTNFTMSYSANPVCCPARACWYTGRPASENGMLSNNHRLREDIPDLGQWFNSRGYNSVYSGKWHVPGREPNKSFTCLTADPSGHGENTDSVVSRSAQSFLISDASHSKPFFLSLGFLLPHDCCHWVISNKNDIGKLPYPQIERELPPLPKNFNSTGEEAEVLKKHLTGLLRATEKWSELHWRYYIWSYYHMVEMADAEIGRVLDALEDSKHKDNTLIVFTADHGDGLGRRHLTSKWFPYDEAIRVPLVICAPGMKDERTDKSHVVSGLDIAPTLCDYAGIEAPPKARGRSLKPLVEGKSADWREFVVSECNITGRMLRTPEYKYINYKNDPVEQLFDMRTDPLEMKNLAGENKHSDTLADLRKRLQKWEGNLEPIPQG